MASCVKCGKNDNVMHCLCGECLEDIEKRKREIYEAVKERLYENKVSEKAADRVLSHLWAILYREEQTK